MSSLEQYRPPGRSNRSGRSQADNDVFEGLPVKQWGHQVSRISLAPPVSETQNALDNKWGDPPMPRDYQMLGQWTQHLLKLARSGKVGTKRKQESDAQDDERPEDENGEEANKTNPTNLDDRGYVAKKWKPVPEHMLVPEHKHLEFLAKRRRGLPSLYAPDLQAAAIPMRKTKVQRADANGETVLYEVLVPEGQHVDGEVLDTTELGDLKPATAAPGTVIEGVGIANEEGVLVAEHLKPQIAARVRNRPPPKKRGGPGRGKKRVTFTNPDGSTYTTIVPNATKIVPQPGQIVKHVAKGEEASADVTAEEAAAANAQRQSDGPEGDDGEEGSDDGDEDGDDDDDREEGEVSDEDAPDTAAATPAKPQTPAESATPAAAEQQQAQNITSAPMEDVKPSTPTESAPEPPNVEPPEAVETKQEEAIASPEPTASEEVAAPPEPVVPPEPAAPIETAAPALQANSEAAPEPNLENAPPPQPTLAVPEVPAAPREPSSSPELPLSANTAHAPPNEAEAEQEPAEDDDLLGNLEKHLEGEKE